MNSPLSKLESVRREFIMDSREVRIASSYCPTGALLAGDTTELPPALVKHAFNCPFCIQITIYLMQTGNSIQGHA
jgi:hypothetical protein